MKPDWEILAQDAARDEVHPASEKDRAWFETGYLSGAEDAIRMAIVEADKIAVEFNGLNAVHEVAQKIRALLPGQAEGGEK